MSLTPYLWTVWGSGQSKSAQQHLQELSSCEAGVLISAMFCYYKKVFNHRVYVYHTNFWHEATPKKSISCKKTKNPCSVFVLLLFELHHFEIWLEETYCTIAVCLFSVQGRFTSTAPYLCWYVDTTWHTLGLTLNSVTKHSVFLLSFSIDVHFYFHCLLTIMLACRCSGGEPVFYVEQNVLQIKWFLGLMKISKRHYWFWHNML